MSYFADRTSVITYSISNELDKLRDVLKRITVINNDNGDHDNLEHNWYRDQDGFTGILLLDTYTYYCNYSNQLLQQLS